MKEVLLGMAGLLVGCLIVVLAHWLAAAPARRRSKRIDDMFAQYCESQLAAERIRHLADRIAVEDLIKSSREDAT